MGWCAHSLTKPAADTRSESTETQQHSVAPHPTHRRQRQVPQTTTVDQQYRLIIPSNLVDAQRATKQPRDQASNQATKRTQRSKRPQQTNLLELKFPIRFPCKKNTDTFYSSPDFVHGTNLGYLGKRACDNCVPWHLRLDRVDDELFLCFL